MTAAHALRSEFERETGAARSYLERVPGDHLGFVGAAGPWTGLEMVLHISEPEELA